ncbi:MAG TPA: hypothetical protein VF017_20700 [Thermoanaerobaculia bacterium]|nr:hypothetical protein [Thermoanaerobaculia bacterium]
MSRDPDRPDFGLKPLALSLAARPVSTLAEGLAILPATAALWGFTATPAQARLARKPAAEWQALLPTLHLLEARLFSPEVDFRWLGGQGVVLSDGGAGGERVAGPGPDWYTRERWCRLWGEHLEGKGSWYEQRIPDPIVYQGLPADPEHRNPFVVLREYVRGGVVEHVRFLTVEGSER